MFNLKGRIPVTVVGGFLGAGKTTLVNHLVSRGGHTFGVIVNEFGDAGIDGSLIENVDEDGVAELSNGCLCCFGRDDLVAALVKLATRETPPEYVLIELSGVADPVPVAQTLLDPYVKGLFDLDGILGVADARTLPRTVQETPEGAVQLAYANTIILNKTDLASAEQLAAARALVHKLNPLARVLGTTHAQVDPNAVLGTHAFDPAHAAETLETEHKAVHTPGLKSFTLHSDRPLERGAFNRFLERMVVSRPDQVYRTKGFVSISGIEQTVLVQAVRDIFNLTLAEGAVTGRSQLVIIGRNLDRKEFERAFAEASEPESVFQRARRLVR